MTLAGRPTLFKLSLVAAVTLVLAALVVAQVDAINGSRFHRWGWWRPRLPPLEIYLSMLVAAAPFAAGQWMYHRHGRVRTALVLVMLSTLLLQLAAVGFHRDPERGPQPFDLGRIARIVAHPVTTSYFNDALRLRVEGTPLRQWLGDYHLHLPHFLLHSREKPPGPVLYWYALLGLFDPPGTAALVGGLLLGLVATASVPASYGLGRVIAGDDRVAFAVAGYVGLIPAIVLFFPSFDQCYPIFACGIIGFWILALRTRSWRWSVACGMTLAAAIFFSYTMLVLGAFMALFGIVHAARSGRPAVAALVVHSCVVLGSVGLVYLLLWMLSGFDPVATFITAWGNQQEWLATFAIPRPHPQTVPGDLQDFLLGSGWISLLLILYALPRAKRWPAERRWLVLLCLAQPLITAATGLIQAETARVWSFMQPMVLTVAGLELARWHAAAQSIVYACLWLLVAAMAQNMIFLY